MLWSKNEKPADQFGNPAKLVIWYGDPYIPWHDPDLPGGKLGQELTIKADGHCLVQPMVFNQQQKKPISGQAGEELVVDEKVAAALLKDAMAALEEVGERVDDASGYHQAATIENAVGRTRTYANYRDAAEINQLAIKIRDALNRADLMVFDGNSHEDFIEEIRIDYSAPASGSEKVTLTRKSNQVDYRRQLPDGLTVSTSYQWPDGEVAALLDRFNPLDFSETIPGLPETVMPVDEELGHFHCQIERRTLPPLDFEGDYEYYCLPQPWQELMAGLSRLTRVSATGDLLDPRYYERRRRRRNEVIYLSVEFQPNGHQYNYLTTDDTIRPGDQVRVPVGFENEEKIVTVVGKHYYQRDEVPYPLSRIKKAIGRVTEDDDDIID